MVKCESIRAFGQCVEYPDIRGRVERQDVSDGVCKSLENRGFQDEVESGISLLFLSVAVRPIQKESVCDKKRRITVHYTSESQIFNRLY